LELVLNGELGSKVADQAAQRITKNARPDMVGRFFAAVLVGPDRGVRRPDYSFRPVSIMPRVVRGIREFESRAISLLTGRTRMP
jgi:hypothetical protein